MTLDPADAALKTAKLARGVTPDAETASGPGQEPSTHTSTANAEAMNKLSTDAPPRAMLYEAAVRRSS
jgi:hypothetical protein